MLKNAGLDMDTVTESTIDLTERAADMASVFNTDVDEALAAIQAGLRGEADPLERFGIGLSAARVEAKALEMTGKELANELTEEEKALARINLIMEQSSAVAGDFQATSDGLANSQRIAAARTEELQAQIGQKLIPVTQKITELKLKLITVLADKVIPKLEELYAKHWPAVNKAIQDVVATVETWWPKLEPIFKFIFDFYKTQVEGFIQQTQGIIQIVQGVVDFVSAIAHGEWANAWTAMKDIAEGSLTLFEGTVKRIFGNIPGIIAGLATDVFNAGVSFANGIINGIKSTLRNFTIPIRISVNGPIPGDVDKIEWNTDLRPFSFLRSGHPYIPRDNFPAMLHRGERVLTADENAHLTAVVQGADKLSAFVASLRSPGGGLTPPQPVLMHQPFAQHSPPPVVRVAIRQETGDRTGVAVNTGPVTIMDSRKDTGPVGDLAHSMVRALRRRGILAL